ncbi:MAG: hypothetical protein K2I18_09840 [Paramuribaculum sp.]|nr:hypothetical protein [Paramuribaculum sp.]
MPVVKFLKYRSSGHLTDLHLTTRQWLKKRCPHIDFGPEPDIEQAATERYRARGAQGGSRKVEGEGICVKVSGDNITEAAGKGSVEAPAGGQIMPEKTTYMTRQCTVADTPAPCAARDGREGGVSEAECPASVREQQPMEQPVEQRFLCKQSASRLSTAGKKQPMVRRSSIADKKRPAVSSCKSPLQTNRLLFAVRSLQRAFVSRCELQRAFASLAIYCQLTRAP